MKKQIGRIVLIVLLVFSLLFLLSGCRSYDDAKQLNKSYGGGYFTLIEKWDDFDGSFRICYANDTKVKYLIWVSGHEGSITPLFNADGTLQIYEGDNYEDKN